MKHYCRYCSHCVGQDGGIGWCEHRNEMVNKKSIRNACNDFDFCEIDAFILIGRIIQRMQNINQEKRKSKNVTDSYHYSDADLGGLWREIWRD